MFEQFLKSGDYALGSDTPSLLNKRARLENPEEAAFLGDIGNDEEEFAFKDLGMSKDGPQAEKRAKTEAQFGEFMKFLAE